MARVRGPTLSRALTCHVLSLEKGWAPLGGGAGRGQGSQGRALLTLAPTVGSAPPDAPTPLLCGQVLFGQDSEATFLQGWAQGSRSLGLSLGNSRKGQIILDPEYWATCPSGCPPHGSPLDGEMAAQGHHAQACRELAPGPRRGSMHLPTQPRLRWQGGPASHCTCPVTPSHTVPTFRSQVSVLHNLLTADAGRKTDPYLSGLAA